jgi:hypothetical protein
MVGNEVEILLSVEAVRRKQRPSATGEKGP